MKTITSLTLAAFLLVSCSRGHDDGSRLAETITPVAVAASVQLPRYAVDVTDYGAVGNGIADDTQAILDAVASITTTTVDDARGGEVFFPIGRYRVSETITVPPNVWLRGVSGSYSSRLSDQTCSAIDGSGFPGPVLRLLRTNTVPEGLFHRGGLEHLGLVAAPDGVAIELGDAGQVDQLHGAWNVTLRDLTVKNADVGVLASHTQEALVEACFFQNCRQPIAYPTVVASSRIVRNTFDAGSATGETVGLSMAVGSQGGSAGVVIEGNYFLGFDRAIRLEGVSGAAIYANQFEGVGAVELRDAVGCWIAGNTWINWRESAVLLVDSSANRIGFNHYRSPWGDADAAVSAPGSSGNRIMLPVIVNPQGVPALASGVEQSNQVD